MSDKIKILTIDDDNFIQKVIAKALNSEDILVVPAFDGESAISMVAQVRPDIILLDVEMPGINGYETCEKLRVLPETCNTPIVFLSSRSTIRERMRGYEVGGDDYLVKPFETENLLARIKILVSYSQERVYLQEKYQLAQKTAVTALTGTSELGMAMRFLENSISFTTTDALVNGLLDSIEQFGLDCCVMLRYNNSVFWYASREVVSPIEKELIEMSDFNLRFLDFGQRTIINYPMVSLLVRNMPLQDMERYGRTKDLLPIFLSAVNVKLSSIEMQEVLSSQSSNMLDSFKDIRHHLFTMGHSILNKRRKSQGAADKIIQSLQSDLISMGLEEDQEDYLLQLIDSMVENILLKMDAGEEIKTVLSFILDNLKSLTEKQIKILDGFSQNLIKESNEPTSLDDNIELF